MKSITARAFYSTIMQHFTQLQAWQIGLRIVEEIYAVSAKFPSSEKFGLTSQVRKSAGSILANIAEGFGRYTYPDKAAKYTIARGECYETEAHLYVSAAVHFIEDVDIEKALKLLQMERRLLSGLITACKERSHLS